MDIDPRTLQQAAARLAQFTSDEALGGRLWAAGEADGLGWGDARSCCLDGAYWCGECC
jgi:hypothetical protein